MVLLREVNDEHSIVSLVKNLEYEVKNAFSGELTGCVSLSVGIATYPKHGSKFDELYRAADRALYYVKNHGKDSYHVYSENDSE